MHDAAQEPSCLPSYKLYARAAERDSSIATPAGGCGDAHAAACGAPELTLMTSAIRVPFAIKLADLLLIHFEPKRDQMVVIGRFRMHDRQIERAARSRVQNAHQCSLRIAIANMKGLHILAPCNGGSRSPDGRLARHCS